jgi:hypothetical protein
MRKVLKKEIDKIDDNEYVWYACYGSNISEDRLMIYINGDINGNFAKSDGCRDKSKPIESKSYIIRRRLYFAKHSLKWNGGVAFLNYRSLGKIYGKIYKIKKSQFIDILNQEQRLKDYDTIIYIGKYKKVPIYTFTALHKLKDLEKPSEEYLNVIKKGIIETYDKLSLKRIDKYIEKISK